MLVNEIHISWHVHGFSLKMIVYEANLQNLNLNNADVMYQSGVFRCVHRNDSSVYAITRGRSVTANGTGISDWSLRELVTATSFLRKHI
jgi:hypothetical protein